MLAVACGRASGEDRRVYERKNVALLNEYGRARVAVQSSRYGTSHDGGWRTTRRYVIKTARTPTALANAAAAKLESRGWVCSPIEATMDAMYRGSDCSRGRAVLIVGFTEKDAGHRIVEATADWDDRIAKFDDD